MTQSYGAPPAPPPMPRPVFVMPPTRSRWPTAIGVISTILGALGVLCAPVSLLMKLVKPGMMRQDPMLGRMPEWFRSYQICSDLVGIVMWAFLLIAGIRLLKRRSVGRSLHIAYAWIGVALTIVGTAVMAYATSSVDLPPGFMTLFAVSIALGVALGLAYPIFLLVWFSRPKIRQEVEGWATPGSYPANVYSQQGADQ